MALGRAERLVEIQELHRLVHEAREESFPNPLGRIYLQGVEDVLDWLLGHCPDGEMGSFDPVENAKDLEWHVVVMRGEAEKGCINHILYDIGGA